ncbi:hypothetical protein RZS08_23930, partial [Arthrospira platensis SPKY1]|nr:hypothetical protein [Arthrospira platensis SPKY1]
MNGFARGHTRIEGINAVQRAFLMGNALVTGIVRRLGQALLQAQHEEQADSSPNATQADGQNDGSGRLAQRRVESAGVGSGPAQPLAQQLAQPGAGGHRLGRELLARPRQVGVAHGGAHLGV